MHVYMLNDPELIQDVLVARHRECIKDVASLKELVRLVGFGLVTLEGESWHKRRKLSEDYAFCRKVQKLGMKVWVDTTVELAHVGTHKFRGRVSDLLEPAEPATKGTP